MGGGREGLTIRYFCITIKMVFELLGFSVWEVGLFFFNEKTR